MKKVIKHFVLKNFLTIKSEYNLIVKYFDFLLFMTIFRMSQALSAITNGMSYRMASSQFNIPKSTLQNRMKNPEMKLGKGSSTVLSFEEEQDILKWIVGSIQRGVPRSSLDVIGGANKILQDRLGTEAQILGRGWLQKFIQRHNLVFRVPENLNKASANLTRQDIEGWFSSISSYFIEHPDLIEALSDRSRVMNADETMV